MNEPNAGVIRKRKSILRRVLDAWQISVTIILVLLVLGFLTSASKLNVPGFPTALFWTTVGAGLLLGLGQLSPVFWRLPRRAVGVLYLATLGFLVLWVVTIGDIQEAWEHTPEGTAEARANADAERLDAKFETERKQEEAEAQKQQQAAQQAKGEQDKLESCFSTFGHHLYDFENAVKNALNNPHSYEHVETVAMPTDADGYNATLTFRGQNGFGAIRTETIRAVIDPDTCKATKIEPEPDSL
jgi:hypothetical protein